MIWKRKKLRELLAVMTASLVFALATNRAEAMLAPAQLPTTTARRAADTQTIQTFLEQKEVAQHLAEMKLNSAEIEARLSNLSDQELHQVVTRIDREYPAGDAGSVAVTVLVIGILALLFVYLLRRV